MDLNLDDLDINDLRALRNKVEVAIHGYDARKRKEALDAMERAAQEFGFKLSDLTQPARGKGASKGNDVVKYAHPDDASITWSGRGRRPAWLTEQLEAGKTIEDMLV